MLNNNPNPFNTSTIIEYQIADPGNMSLFIYDKDERLISILYEVKNTFGEQHTYVFKVEGQNKLIENNCSKKFHVSPFIEMDCNYFFKVLNCFIVCGCQYLSNYIIFYIMFT